MEHSHPRSGQEPYAKPLRATEPLVWALADALKGKQTDVSAMERGLGVLIRHCHAYLDFKETEIQIFQD